MTASDETKTDTVLRIIPRQTVIHGLAGFLPFSGFHLHLAGEHELQVVLGVDRQVFDQVAPEVLAEVRHLIRQAFQR